MKISAAARLNAAATIALAVLVAAMFIVQSRVLRAVDSKIEKCVSLRLHLGDIRIVLYESENDLDEKKAAAIESQLAALSGLVREADAEIYGVKNHGITERYSPLLVMVSDMSRRLRVLRGEARREYLDTMRLRAQRGILDTVTSCAAAENGFKQLRKHIRVVTTAAVIASVTVAACAALALSLFFSGRIQNSVARLAAHSRAVSSGQTGPPDGVGEDDEFFPVYEAMREMALSLQRASEDLAREDSRLRRVGAELRETSEFLDKIVTNASAPIVVWGSDFTITMFNRAFERMTLYRASEVIGRRLSMLFSEETAAASFEKIRRALDGEQWDSVDLPIRRKDGAIRIVLWNSANILAGDGSVAATVAQGQDITDRIETLRELKASERRYRMLFSEIQTGIALHEIICDGSGNPIDYRFLEVNPAYEQLVGRAASALIGRTVREVMPRTERFWIERFGGVALNGEPGRFEGYACELARYFEVVAYSPERRKFAVLFSDITERKLAEQKIMQMNAELERKVEERTIRLETYTKELEAFSYSVSHDLRAPLRSIEGFSTALEEDFAQALPAPARDYLSRIRGATSRMGSLIDDLLSLSRITRSEMDVADIDISAMFCAAFDELALSLPRAGVVLRIQPGVIVRGDARLVQIVVTNLASNAWKFTSGRDDPRISFDAREEAAERCASSPTTARAST